MNGWLYNFIVFLDFPKNSDTENWLPVLIDNGVHKEPDLLMIQHFDLFCVCVCKTVNDLEDKLLQSETCHREALQKIVELESALQNANGELKITLTQLQESQEALQNAQSSLEEKHVAVMNLTAELR